MELRQLNTFIKIAQHNSFCKAAEQLGYSQAAVTIQIKQLETELGVQLFDRIGKQTTLTQAGKVFYQYASDTLRNLAQVKNILSDATELTGSLVIGSIESICASILPSLIESYHRLHPKVRVNIIIDSPNALLTMMEQNRLDLVYFLDKRMYDAKWIKILEEPEEVVFVAPPEHELSSCKNLSLDQVISYPMLLTEKDASYRYILDQYLASEGKSIIPYLESGNTEFIIKLLKSTCGVSLLPRFSVQNDIDSGLLQELRIENFHMKVWRQIVYHKDKWISREMQAFINLIQSENLL